VRLGAIPTTRKWKAVVALLSGDGDGNSADGTQDADQWAQIASETLAAAQAGLEKYLGDPGLSYTFYLLTQVALSARQHDWQGGLAPLGIQLAVDSSLFDLTAELHHAVDEYLAKREGTSDASEMAQQAAGEAITFLAGPRAVTLFGSGRDELQAAIRDLSTRDGFARLGQEFFGRFMARFLNFYLSRVTSAQLGGNVLRQLGDVSQFNQMLEVHCLQSARIVRDFCGEWYSKTEFQQGINPANTSGFIAVAIRKLRDELQRQGSVQ
jgi:hypothetical protein